MIIQLRKTLEAAPTGDQVDNFDPYLEFFPYDGASTPLGAVIVLAGGGYNYRSSHEDAPVARRFNQLGFHAFTLQYRVKPYTFPAPQRDILRAIKLIRQNAASLRVKEDNIAVLGFSAGGHLAGSSGVMYDRVNCDENDDADKFSCRPNALILCYPVIAATEPFAHRGSMVSLLGENAPEELKQQMNLHKLVNADTPPAFLWHTADDAAVPVRNSIEFANAMWQNGNSCELHIYPHGTHGKGLGHGLKDIVSWTSLAATFLEATCNFTRA